MFRRLYSNLSQRVGFAAMANTRSAEVSDTDRTITTKKSKRSNSNDKAPTSVLAPAEQSIRITNPNKKHPCGSILSANANYSHWYAHRYGIPHQNSASTDSAPSRDLEQLMQLQHTNPNVNLYPFLSMGECLSSDVAEKKDGDQKRSSSADEEEAVSKACSVNENHAHWFKHQYCMVPDWEVDCFQQSRTHKSSYSNGTKSPHQRQGEKEMDPIEAHSQPRRDIRSFDFSVRVQHAHLDTRDASKLFNII